MMFPKSSCPEAMVRGEKELIESDKLDNEFIHINKQAYDNTPHIQLSLVCLEHKW